MRRISSVPALLFGTQLSGFTQSLTFAWLPMVCLMPYWSARESWRQMLLQIQLIIVKFLSGLSKAPQVFSCLNLLDGGYFTSQKWNGLSCKLLQ